MKGYHTEEINYLNHIPLGYAVLTLNAEALVCTERNQLFDSALRLLGHVPWDKNAEKYSANVDLPIPFMLEAMSLSPSISDHWKNIAKLGSSDFVELSSNDQKNQYSLQIYSPKIETLVLILQPISRSHLLEDSSKNDELTLSLISALPDIIFKFDRDLRFIFCHSQNPDLLIRPANEFLGKQIVDVLPPPLANLLLSKIEELHTIGDVIQFEYTIPLDIGQSWFEARLVKTNKNEIICIVRDVTDKKKSELEYFSILEATQDGFWLNDLNGVILDVNTAYSQMVGYSKNEIIGERVEKFDAIDDRKLVEERIQRLHRFGSDRFESLHRRKDGSCIDVEVSINYLPYAGGRLIVFVRDITERKKLEQVIRASKSQYEELTKQIPVGVYTFRSSKNGNHRFEFASERFLDLLALDKPDLILDPLYPLKLVYKKERKAFGRIVRQSISNGKPFSLETRFLVERYARWFRVDAIPSLQSNGDQLWNGVLTDITDRKQTEELLLFTSSQAEAASRAKSEFLANMSHEIRTPLNGIIGFQDMLAGTTLSQEQIHYLENANTSAHSLLSVINDILDFSKIEAGKIVLEEVFTDIYQLIEESIDIVKFSALKKGLDLLIRIQPNIPQLVKIDPTRVKQVLVNLLGNAIKFTEVGEVRLDVKFDIERIAQKQVTKIEFSITDTGIGIASEKQKLLFRPFSQADTSTTRTFGGSGLGLVISQSFVNQMGSSIDLKSEPKKGSTFSFTLAKEFKVLDHYFLFSKPFKGALVVDSNKKHSRILIERLDAWSIPTFLGTNSDEALEVLTMRPEIDLVFIDFDTIKESDISFYEKLKQIHPRFETELVMTYNSTNTVKVYEKSQKEKISHLLMKPIKILELYLTLKNINGEILAKPKITNPVLGSSLKTLKPNILIVEDVSVNMLLMKGILTKLIPNVMITEATDGEQAILKTSDKSFDLIFMDIQMPNKDGYEATKEIRKISLHQKTPIVALTAGVLKGEKEKCIEAGMNDYLSKPIDRKDLVSKLETFLVYEKTE